MEAELLPNEILPPQPTAQIPVPIEVDPEDAASVLVACQARDKDLVKEVPGTRWDPRKLTWKARKTWPACIQLREAFGGRLEIGEQLWTWAEPEAEASARRLELRDAPDAESVDAFPHEVVRRGQTVVEQLSPLQKACVAFLADAGQAFCADPMGGGKTPIAARLLEQIGDDAYPALVVCTATMKDQWLKHFEEWSPGRVARVVQGGAAARRKILAEEGVDVFIMNWEQLRAHSRLAPYGPIRLSDKEKEEKELNAMPIRTVVADAAQKGTSPAAKQTRALWKVGWDAEYRFAMTGSVGDEAAVDLWPIMHFVAPDEWPSRERYIDRYAVKDWNVFGFMEIKGIRPDRREELHRILHPRFIRRPKEILLPEVPARGEPEVRTLEMTPKQKRATKQLKKELMAELDEGVLLGTNPLTKMTRLLQLASSWGEVEDYEKDGQMRQRFIPADPSNKIDALIEDLREAGDEPIVVFGVSRRLIELAASRLARLKSPIPCAQITGAVKQADRTDAIRAFQEGELNTLLVQTATGGEGITLTAASVGIFLQSPPSFRERTEAEGRLDRRGQEKPVRFIDYVSEGSPELGVLETIAEKEGRLEELVQDEANLRRWLSP